MNRRTLISAICAAAAVRAAAAGVSMKPEDAMPTLAARAGAIRAAAAANPESFARFIAEDEAGEAAAAAWQKVAEEFSATQLRDFFSAANVIPGPAAISGRKWSGVCALYNPWLDAVLALRFDDTMRMDRVAFVGGEAFRGEAPASPPATATVVPGADPLSVELWRVQARTVARFAELFPKGAEKGFDSTLAPARRRGFEAVQARSALHLKLLAKFAQLDGWGKKPGSSKLASAAATMRELLRAAPTPKLRQAFADPTHAFFCDTFAALSEGGGAVAESGADIRAGFGLYHYVPSPDGTLFVFLNPSLPRIYATVSFPAGRENDPSGPPVVFEWYDLAQSSRLLEAARPGELDAGEK